MSLAALAVHTSAPSDRARQVVLAASAVLAVAGSAVGSGALGGTPIAEAAGGALSSTATLVAPAGPAFSIWSVIYAGLVALAARQLLPAHRTDARQRRTGWWTAASLLLNAAWILAVQAGLLVLSTAVLLALLAVLVVVVGRLGAVRPAGRAEALVVDGTLGLYLGWVSTAAVAGTAATLAGSGAGGLGLGEEVWAVVVLALAAAVGAATAVLTRGRLAPAAGLAWGLAWVAVGRSAGSDSSTAAALTAAAAAVVVAGSAVAVRLRRRRAVR